MYSAADLVGRLRGNDELLGPGVTIETAKKALSWLSFFAARLGVDFTEVQENFIVEQLLQLYAYREVCVLKSYGLNAPFGRRTGAEDPDYYGRKLAYYEERIRTLEKTVTAADLTRGDGSTSKEETPYKNYRAVAVHRG